MKTEQSDIEAAAGVVQVRLNGLHERWPRWGHTLLHVANSMTSCKCYHNKGSMKSKLCVMVRKRLHPRDVSGLRHQNMLGCKWVLCCKWVLASVESDETQFQHSSVWSCAESPLRVCARELAVSCGKHRCL